MANKKDVMSDMSTEVQAHFYNRLDETMQLSFYNQESWTVTYPVIWNPNLASDWNCAAIPLAKTPSLEHKFRNTVLVIAEVATLEELIVATVNYVVQICSRHKL